VSGANLDTAEPVITGLPVSAGDHAVNGLEFGDKGELYIQVGSNTNGGIAGEFAGVMQEENYFSAATLVAHMGNSNFDGALMYDADDDGNPVGGHGIEVFAAGLRNPYGITLRKCISVLPITVSVTVQLTAFVLFFCSVCFRFQWLFVWNRQWSKLWLW
jgi:glucose/arabinose dehydrogenase